MRRIDPVVEAGVAAALEHGYKAAIRAGMIAALAEQERRKNMPVVDGKRCPRCKEEKPRSEFGRNQNRRDGLADYCKVCSRAIQRRWVLLNSEKLAERRRDARRFREAPIPAVSTKGEIQ